MADLKSIRLSGTTQELAERLNENFTEVELRKVDRELKTGSESVYKELTDNNYTDTEKSRLAGIEEGAEVNIIETVKVNDVALTPTERVINITVPVNAGDVNALPDTTKYGANVDLTYTSETGVLGISLKDQDGTELGSDTVDLPMELIIQSGTVETCTVDDVPVVGYVVGDKYLDLLLANDNHIYVLVSDLIDQITIEETGEGNAVTDISINGNVITETKGKTFVEVEEGKGLSSNDYTDEDKSRLANTSGTNTGDQPIVSEAFTSDDIRWSELTESYYTLTIVSAKTPISSAKKLISGTNYGDVLATVTSDGTNIYVISDTKFEGKILTV